MVKSMNAAIAGLKSHQTKMDVLSNNIANVNTWGFKSRTTNFQDALYSNSISGSAGATENGKLGGINTSQIGYGNTVSSISTNFSTGSRQYTGNPLDCMIDGTAFFIVGPFRGQNGNATAVEVGKIGESGLFLSRVGIFQPDSNGYLVDNTGNYVYGFAAKADGSFDVTGGLVPIQIPEDKTAGGGARLSIQTWTIGTDGTVVGVDDKNVPHTIGKIAVASVENPSGLEQNNGLSVQDWCECRNGQGYGNDLRDRNDPEQFPRDVQRRLGVRYCDHDHHPERLSGEYRRSSPSLTRCSSSS